MTVFRFEPGGLVRFASAADAKATFTIKCKDLLVIMDAYQKLAGDTLSPTTQHAVGFRLQTAMNNIRRQRRKEAPR